MAVLELVLSPEACARLHDMLSCLAKFGPTVSLEAHGDYLSLSALNSSKSAYASFRLGGNSFFEAYKLNLPNSGREAKFTCNLFNKAMSSVFKAKLGDSRSRDTAVSRCELKVQESDEQTECRIVIRMSCIHGVTKTYALTYESAQVVHAVFNGSAANNRWKTQAGFLREFSEYFAPRAEQLDVYMEDGRVTFLSFTDKIVNAKNEVLKTPLKTAVTVSIADFAEFDARERLHIVINLKDFKSIVAHAATLGTSICASYSVPGCPLQFTYAHEGLVASFILMTAAEYGQTPSPSPESTAAGSTNTSAAPSVVVLGEQVRRQAERDDMPAPGKVSTRQLTRALGQRMHYGRKGARAIEPEPELNTAQAESLFVQDDDDGRWDPQNYDPDEESMGWDTSADRNSADFQQTFKDTQAASARMLQGDEFGGLPPTQRISQIQGLW